MYIHLRAMQGDDRVVNENAAAEHGGDPLVELDVRAGGPRVTLARTDVAVAAQSLEYYAGMAAVIHGKAVPLGDGGLISLK